MSKMTRAPASRSPRAACGIADRARQGERDLDFTFVRAAVDGTLFKPVVNTGDMIQAGQRLGSLVPLDEVFIDANYRKPS